MIVSKKLVVAWLIGGLAVFLSGCGAQPNGDARSAPEAEISYMRDIAEAELPDTAGAGVDFPAEAMPGDVESPAPDSREEMVGTKPPDPTEKALIAIAPAEAPRAGASESPDPRPRYTETEDGRHLVDVFYATDRAPLFQLGPTPRSISVLLAAIITALLAVLLFIAALHLRRFKSACLIVLAAVAICGLWLRTDRIPVPIPDQALLQFGDWYGADRHEVANEAILEVGLCQVSLPSDHRVGHLESPSIFRLEFQEDVEKHVVIQSLKRLEDDEFYESLSEHVRGSPRKEALLFIHGYNVGFSDAVKRTAQMAYDLRFPGAALCYTWPSQGGFAAYKTDEANVGWTVVHLDEFLETVVQRTGVQRLHLIAHSMGNRALTQALERIALRQSEACQQFGQVILAAPDIDTGEFRQRYAPVVSQLAEHATLYTSSHDRALLLSASIHGYNRLGLSRQNLTSFPGIDTIDASPVDTSLIGHCYYGDNPELIRDLRSVLKDGLPAENRAWLQKIVRDPQLHFWTFRPPTDRLAESDDLHQSL